jgi:hypothetical protein
VPMFSQVAVIPDSRRAIREPIHNASRAERWVPALAALGRDDSGGIMQSARSV